MDNPLIFIHSGVYHGDFLLIDSPVSLIGAGLFLNDFSHSSVYSYPDHHTE